MWPLPPDQESITRINNSQKLNANCTFNSKYTYKDSRIFKYLLLNNYTKIINKASTKTVAMLFAFSRNKLS